MKRFILIAGVLFMTLTAGAFELGKQDGVIFHNRVNLRAALRMSKLLEKVFCKKYTVKEVDGSDVSAPGIYIGFKPAEATPRQVAGKREFICTYADESRIFLWGEDRDHLKGSYFAVCDFLEKHCGVHFLWPGELGTVAEKHAPVTLEKGYFYHYIPPFDVRLTNSFNYGTANLTLDELHNQNAWLDAGKVGRSVLPYSGSGFQHAFASLMPREIYGKAHPEYYALVSPERWIGEPKPDKPTRLNDPMQSGPWQLCTSNPEVRRIIAEKLAANDTDRIQSISPNDGYGFCECENCKAQDGKDAGRIRSVSGHHQLTNRMYDFVQEIAIQAQKLNPKTRVGMFAYSLYDTVPEQKIAFPGNVYLSYCYLVYAAGSRQKEDEINNRIAGLAATGGKVIGREYWGTHYTMEFPLFHSRKIDRNIKALRKANAAGIYGETGNSFGVRATDLYILAKLSWNPDLKREDILRDFCVSAFGAQAAPVMYELFEKIEDWTEQGFARMMNESSANRKFYSNGYAETNYMMARLYGKEFAGMCEPFFRKAAKLVDTPERKARLQYMRNGIGYAGKVSDALKSYQDLAAMGISMPLTMPSTLNAVMEKNEILKVVSAALRAAQAREFYINRFAVDGCISRSRRSNAIDLRPWGALAEIALIDLRAGRYNYLVNGAFEYSGFSWDIKTTEGKSDISFVTTTNCDADNNYMVTSHANQGISLSLAMKPGSKVEIKQLRPIAAKTPMSASCRLFVKCKDGDPGKFVKVFLGKHRLETVWVDEDFRENGDWCELRCRAVDIEPGEYIFRIVVENPDGIFGGSERHFNFDELRLRLTDRNK